MAYRKPVMDYTRFLSQRAKLRTPSMLRVLTEVLARSPPSMISLAGGLPNPQLFPFESASVKLRDGSTMELDEKTLSTGLQYGPTPGIPALVSVCKDLQQHYHQPPLMSKPPQEGGFDLCMTSGAMDGIEKAFSMLVNPGDNVLIENPTYSGVLTAVRPIGCNLIPVDNDLKGLQPELLRAALSKWSPQDALDPNSSIPKVLYTIPNGANPTGFSLDDDRKKEIYQIAQEYNLIILEDDPYYFLQYQEPYAPSFLSMDVDGRVLRFDSFSKILSSGMRLGFASGPQPLIRGIVLHTMSSNISASQLSQILVLEILNKWGLEGFQKHVDQVVSFYRDQKDAIIKSAKKHLTGLAEWSEPQAGMFLWMRLLGINDTFSLIMEKAPKKEVLLVPGGAFLVDDSLKSAYLRASFSLASPEQMEEGIKRLADLIREELDQGEDKSAT